MALFLSNKPTLVGLSILLSTTASLSAAESVDSAMVEHSSLLPRLTPLSWNNPSLLGLVHERSLSHAGALYGHESDEWAWGFNAKTYMKLGKSIVTGEASYFNGKLTDVYNIENVDRPMTYPYFVYDAVGGEMKQERYAFSGSYSNDGDRFVWGVSGGYRAGLFYRNVDPRPRDITGLLSLSGGFGVKAGGYVVSLSVGYDKYKQSCDISFVSELGASTIYHLTGLGTVYSRFTGLGTSVYYSGHSFRGSLNLYPNEQGFFATVGVSRMSMTCILRDLNKLPMSRLTEPEISVEAGWKNGNIGGTLFWNASRRHGYENIFGDAAAGQYPVIGELGMLACNVYGGGARLAFEHRFDRLLIGAMPSVGWFHRREVYVTPRREMFNELLAASVKGNLSFLLPRGMTARLAGSVVMLAPGGHSISGVATDNNELVMLVEDLTADYSLMSSTRWGGDVEVGFSMPVNSKISIGASVSYSHLKSNSIVPYQALKSVVGETMSYSSDDRLTVSVAAFF